MKQTIITITETDKGIVSISISHDADKENITPFTLVGILSHIIKGILDNNISSNNISSNNINTNEEG